MIPYQPPPPPPPISVRGWMRKTQHEQQKGSLMITGKEQHKKITSTSRYTKIWQLRYSVQLRLSRLSRRQLDDNEVLRVKH